jgi:hypothetical protein
MVKKLTGSVIERNKIDLATRGVLYDLFFRYYQKVDKVTFHEDLEEKDWILILKDEFNVIQGFTTMKLYTLSYQGEDIRVIFSGNTIINREHWGEVELMKTWGKFMAQRKCEYPSTRLFWYLICSGYRTYLFLPFFFNTFYPCTNKETPQYEKELIDILGFMKFPKEYRNGIVEVTSPRECLVPDIAIPSVRKLNNPHVSFFLESNPDYLVGNELVCITEFSLENNMRLARTCLLDEITQQDQVCSGEG